MRNFIELRNISKSFYKSKKLSFRIKNINFKASKGQIIILKGQNGSGKTTLLKLIKQLSFPDSGKIIISPDINYRDIAFQAANENTFFPRLTARENLEFFLGMKGYSLKDSFELFDNLRLSIDILERRFFNLSLGEKKKLSLIRTFIGQPKQILLDEPTVSLDYPSQKGLIKIINSYRDLGSTFIVATHESEIFGDTEVSVIKL